MRFPTLLRATLVRTLRAASRLAGAALVCGLLVGCSGGGGETSGGGGDAPSFGLTLGQSSGAAAAGQNLALNLQVQPTAGFGSAVSLSALNLPAGVSASFSPNPLTPGTQTAACTFAIGAGAAAVNAHPVQVQASGGGVTRTATYALTITAPVPGIGLSLGQPSGTLAAGGNLGTAVQLEAQNGFSGTVTLSASNLPAGVQAAFQPASLALPGTGASNLLFTAAPGALPASGHPVTIQATAGGASRQATFLLSVSNPNAPGFDLSASAASTVLLPGGTRDLYITVTPRSGFSGAITFGASGLPSGTTASFTPQGVTVAGGAVSTVLRLAASAGAASSASPVQVAISGQGAGSSAVSSHGLRVAPAGDPVAVRLGALNAVEARFHELAGQNLPPLALLQGVAATMAARSEYQAAGVDTATLNAWGRLKDGTVHLVAANREPAPPGSPAPAVAAATVGAEVPGATKARLLHSFGPNFEGQTPVDQMRTYLQGRNWTVRPGAEGEAHVGTLKGVAGDGFFYINTHGGRAEVDDPSLPDGKIYSIQSSTQVDENYERLYEGDLKGLRLVHFTARTGDQVKVLGFTTPIPVVDTRYAITYRFVDAYMSFAPGSVVWLNACYSGRSADFLNAFLRKGAAVVLGWSELLSAGAAYASAPYFVDRMLGANQHEPKESPAQRAFPYDQVLADMAGKGLDKDAATGGLLRATVKSGLAHPPIFAPSIKRMQVDESEDKLHLHGHFGTEPGTVKVDGTAVAAQWAADHLVCTLPRTGAGASGDVVVEVRSVKSNARQLTEWPVPLQYTWTSPGDMTGTKVEGSGTLRLRADIDGFREQPGEDLQFEARGGVATQDSEVTVTASGSYTPSGGGCTSTLSGTGVFPSSSRPSQGNLVLANAFLVDGKTRQGALGLALGAGTPPHTLTRSGGPGCSGSFPYPSAFALLEGPYLFPVGSIDEPPVMLPLPALTFTAGGSYGIPAKSSSRGDWGGTLKVEIKATGAKFPPRDGDDCGR